MTDSVSHQDKEVRRCIINNKRSMKTFSHVELQVRKIDSGSADDMLLRESESD